MYPKTIDYNAVRKFGRNAVVGATEEDVWAAGATKTNPTTAGSLYISSSNQAADVGIEVTLEYLDSSGVQKQVTAQLHATDARTFVDTGVTALDCNRAWLSGDGETLTGTVYISNDNTDAGGDGIPDSATNILATIPPADGQTMQAIYRVPSNATGWLYSYGVTSNTIVASQSIDFKIKKLEPGGSWRTIESGGITTGEYYEHTFHRAEKLPGGTIVKIVAAASTGSADVSAHFEIDLEF